MRNLTTGRRISAGVTLRRWIITGAAVALIATAAYQQLYRAPGSPDLSRLIDRRPTAGPEGSAARPSLPGSQASVPETLPSAEPALDRALSVDYRKALEGQGIRVLGLAITDRRATGGARRADILFRTATDGRPASLRPEIVRIIGAGTNSRLALDMITIRAARPDGTIAATISVTVPEVDRWLRGQMDDEEFFSRWVVRTPSR